MDADVELGRVQASVEREVKAGSPIAERPGRSQIIKHLRNQLLSIAMILGMRLSIGLRLDRSLGETLSRKRLSETLSNKMLNVGLIIRDARYMGLNYRDAKNARLIGRGMIYARLIFRGARLSWMMLWMSKPARLHRSAR
jgi:hypothetical protein